MTNCGHVHEKNTEERRVFARDGDEILKLKKGGEEKQEKGRQMRIAPKARVGKKNEERR